MFRIFLKSTFRNLSKNVSYVIINLLGLSLSLACCIVAYLNFKYADDFDKNHEKYKRIYKIHVYKTVQGNRSSYGITPLPLGQEIRDLFSGIKRQARYTDRGLVLKKGDNIFNERIGFADTEIFSMLTFPFKYGQPDAINDQSNLILSEETALKYYGDINPVGELITVIGDDGNPFSMTIGGVLEKIPQNSSVRFGGICNFDKYLSIYELENNDWTNFVGATFIETTDNTYPEEVPEILNERFLEIQNRARDDWQIGGFYLEPLETLGKHGDEFWANWLSQAPPKPAISTPFIMAILLLLIACFNFTNTSIAISSKRLKEIGMRKVLGGTRRQLIYQFMGENLLMSTIALIFGTIIAIFLVPAYSAMWDFIDLKLDFTQSFYLYRFLIIILIFTSAVSGFFPSIYISSYQPVNILKGSFTISGSDKFSRFLLTTQFSLTIISLIASVAFSQNAKYQANLDVGFQKTDVIAVRVENQSEYERYRNAISQNPSIVKVVGTRNHIGNWNYSRTLRHGELEIDALMMDYGMEYDQVMDLTILEGRYFAPDLYDHDRENSIIVSETMAKQFGWKEPIGKVVQYDDSTRLTVIGVMKDFYMFGFWDPVEAYAFRLADKEQMNFVVSRIRSDQLKTAYDYLEKAWYDVEPNKPFDGWYQDEFIAGSELVNTNITKMFFFLGLLALILSVIGLFTLVSLTIIKRTKEIGIRKALGASIPHIILIMNRQYIWILGIAILVGGASSIFLIDALMSSIFAYYKSYSVLTIGLPIFLIILISLFTSSSRILVAAQRNPVQSLRYE